MTAFENLLLEKGYKKYSFNCKTMKHVPVEKHNISSLVNLDHRYVLNEDFDNVICFGLHEANKPPTLISPRPRIRVKRTKNDQVVIEDERLDDSMNVVLGKEDPEMVFNALFDDSIQFEYDLSVTNHLKRKRERLRGAGFDYFIM
jgi:hypothetical protein